MTNTNTSLDLFPLQDMNNAEADLRPAESGYYVDEEAQVYWAKCLDFIRDNVSGTVYKTWFQPLRALKWKDRQLTLQVPSQFFYEWIEEHYHKLLQKAVEKIFQGNAGFKYEVVVDKGADASESRTIKIPASKSSSGSFGSVPSHAPWVTNLNQRYTFENFVVGDSNQFARSAAIAVAQNPGTTKYNPLFIYSAPGLGKTHLVQAIGNYISRSNPKLKVLYTSSERFTMDFVNSIQNDKVNEFRNYYRSIDVFILDDIQFLEGKEKTQDNFFYTFNELHQAGKQLILTSDRPAKELKGLDERLISRFQWGLQVDIGKPEAELRMAILRKKAADEGVDLPMDVSDFLARNIDASVRELEGTLISLLAKVTLDKRELNLQLASEVVKGVVDMKPKEMTIDIIKQVVSEHYKISVEVMESSSRKQEIALSRQMSMYLAKQLTKMSLKAIGAHFGGRDHSTVLHSCTAIENYLVTDRKVRSEHEKLLHTLKSMM